MSRARALRFNPQEKEFTRTAFHHLAKTKRVFRLEPNGKDLNVVEFAAAMKAVFPRLQPYGDRYVSRQVELSLPRVLSRHHRGLNAVQQGGHSKVTAFRRPEVASKPVHRFTVTGDMKFPFVLESASPIVLVAR